MSSSDKSNVKRKQSSQRRRVRKFRGNQFTKIEEPQNQKQTDLASCLDADEPVVVRVQECPLNEENEATAGPSNIVEDIGPSRKKIARSQEGLFDDEVDDGFRLIYFEMLKSLFSQACVCSKCKVGQLSLYEDKARKMGMASFIILKCEFCQHITETYSSPCAKGSRSLEINLRAVLAMNETGGGRTSLVKICGLLNMPGPMDEESYSNSVRVLKDACEEQAKASMRKAADEEHSFAESPTDEVIECKAMFDGTWRKRGFSSLQGGVTAISPVTGKCLDYETLNRSCSGCTRWKSKPESPEKERWLAEHKCAINFVGSAPAMEPEGVQRIFQRSEAKNHLQYTGYIGDGDSKSFSMVKASKPYKEKDILKLECVGHIQKRMGTALRKAKSQHGAKKLTDGKSIGGQGRLTGERIDKLQVYYGLAIRRHKDDLNGMKKEVWAGLYHSSSTDESPMHQFCPNTDDTWCKYIRAEKDGKDFHHTKPLPKAVFDVIKPVYERLSKEELLQGCLGGYTQNSCEALNHLIWDRCPKSRYSGRDHLDCAAASAVLVFNDGLTALCRVLHALGISPGKNTRRALKKLDSKRIRESDRHVRNIQKKIRKSKRNARKAVEETQNEAEGTVYASGAF